MSVTFGAPKRLITILLIMLLHGLLYATFLPPWGLIDEAQHVDYIQSIAEKSVFPVANRSLISQNIVDSMFATHHWDIFHWPTPSSKNPEQLGLVAFSYEAYQPPGFYLLMAFVYRFLSGDVLWNLFMSRWIVILLSLVTPICLYQIASMLFPQQFTFRWLALLLLYAIPERTIAVSRVNNDVLLEVMSALCALLLTSILISGLTKVKSVLLGLCIAVGVWVKFSMALWVVPCTAILYLLRREKSLWSHVVPALSIVVLATVSLMLRNLSIYHDLTGYAGFHALFSIAPPTFSFSQLLHASWTLSQHFWIIWWKGDRPESNLLIASLTTLLLLMSVIGLVTTFYQAIQSTNRMVSSAQKSVFQIYLITFLTYFAFVIVCYFQGIIPVLQGRFMLPAVIPLILLITFGFSQMKFGLRLLCTFIIILLLLDLLFLYGNLIPYHYYWSTIEGYRLVDLPYSGLRATLSAFQSVFSIDKPPPLIFLLPWLAGLNGMVFIWIGWQLIRTACQSSKLLPE